MDMTIHEEKLTKDRRKDIERVYKESGDWNKVITTVVCKDCPSSMHAFVDFVEEHFNTKLRDAKHIKMLTGITEETLDDLEETLIFGREDAYRIAIMKAIIKGTKYKGLLEIEPKGFGLPNRWIAFYPSEEVDKGRAVELAIASFFQTGEPSYIRTLSLRNISEYIEAPYSVILDGQKAYRI